MKAECCWPEDFHEHDMYMAHTQATKKICKSEKNTPSPNWRMTV